MSVNWEGLDFTRDELKCKCGCERMELDPQTILNLQDLRDQVGPLVISSAYRCENHENEKAKDRPGTHQAGHAIDIKCSGERATEVLEAAMAQGCWTGVGIAQRGTHSARFIHLDNMPVGGKQGYEHIMRPNIWSY